MTDSEAAPRIDPDVHPVDDEDAEPAFDVDLDPEDQGTTEAAAEPSG